MSTSYICYLLVLANTAVGLTNVLISKKIEQTTDPITAFQDTQESIEKIEDEDFKRAATNFVNYIMEDKMRAIALQIVVYMIYFLPIINILILKSFLKTKNKDKEDK